MIGAMMAARVWRGRDACSSAVTTEAVGLDELVVFEAAGDDCVDTFVGICVDGVESPDFDGDEAVEPVVTRFR